MATGKVFKDDAFSGGHCVVGEIGFKQVLF